MSSNYLSRLKEIGNKMEKKGMKIYNIRPAHQHLRLGQLKGNHFDIVVRDLQHHSHDSSADLKERIAEAVGSVEVRKAHDNEQSFKSLLL